MLFPTKLLAEVSLKCFPDKSGSPTNFRSAKTARFTPLRPWDKARHTMLAQKFDIRRPEESGGEFEERYWSPINSPLIGAGGEV